MADDNRKPTVIRIAKMDNQFYLNANDLLGWLDTLTGSVKHIEARDHIRKQLTEMFFNDNVSRT